MDDTTLQGIFGVGLPLIAAAVSGWWVPADAGERLSRRTVLAPAVATAAMVIAFLGLYGAPAEQWQSVMWVPLVGLGGALVWTFWRRSLSVPLVAAVVAAGSMAAVWPVLARETWAIRSCGAIVAFVLILLVEPVARRRPGPAVPIALGLSLGGTAGLILLSGFLKLALPVAALGFAIGGLGLVALFRRRAVGGWGVVAVAAPVLAQAPLVAWLYMTSGGDTMPIAAFFLVALAPLGLWVGELPFVLGWRAWLAASLRIVAVLVLVGAGVGLAVTAEDEAAEDDPYADLYGEMMGG